MRVQGKAPSLKPETCNLYPHLKPGMVMWHLRGEAPVVVTEISLSRGRALICSDQYPRPVWENLAMLRPLPGTAPGPLSEALANASVDDFLRDRCVRGSAEWAVSGTLRAAYLEYCAATGRPAISWTGFSNELLRRGFWPGMRWCLFLGTRAKRRCWRGVGLVDRGYTGWTNERSRVPATASGQQATAIGQLWGPGGKAGS